MARDQAFVTMESLSLKVIELEIKNATELGKRTRSSWPELVSSRSEVLLPPRPHPPTLKNKNIIGLEAPYHPDPYVGLCLAIRIDSNIMLYSRAMPDRPDRFDQRNLGSGWLGTEVERCLTLNSISEIFPISFEVTGLGTSRLLA